MIPHILIAMTYAISQAHMSQPAYWPVTTFQEFNSKASCEAAAAQVKHMANGKVMSVVCMQK